MKTGVEFVGERFLEKQAEYDALAYWYDTLYPRSEDFSYYEGRIAELGSPVLELGCGTGRLTCNLAAHGATVVGLDLSRKQLDRAQKRKELLNEEVASRIEFRQGTMTCFSFPERFPLIAIPFSALLELQTAQDRIETFVQCLGHLTPSGKLIFDNFFRGSGDLEGWGKPRPANVVTFWGIHPHPDPAKRESEIHHFEVQEYEPAGGMLLTIFIDQVSRDGVVTRKLIRVRRQYVSPEDSVHELRLAGFGQIRVYGSFDRREIGDPVVSGRGRIVCEASI